MQKNQIIIGILSLVAIFGFLFGAYYFTNKGSTQSADIDPTVLAIKKNDHIKWSPQKKNILVEYSDLQCPACKYFHDVMKPWESAKSGDEQKIASNVTFVYRHYPLPMHQNSDEAAYAAEAAGQQGKFFQMTDLLFEKQAEWEKLGNPQAKFVEYAKLLKLDEEKFKKAYNSGQVKARINEDIQSGDKAAVPATPTFYFNGKQIEAKSLDEFKRILLDGIQK